MVHIKYNGAATRTKVSAIIAMFKMMKVYVPLDFTVICFKKFRADTRIVCANKIEEEDKRLPCIKLRTYIYTNPSPVNQSIECQGTTDMGDTKNFIVVFSPNFPDDLCGYTIRIDQIESMLIKKKGEQQYVNLTNFYLGVEEKHEQLP